MNILFTAIFLGMDLVGLIGAVGGFIGVVGATITGFYIAKKKAQDNLQDERIKSLEDALEIERENKKGLIERIDFLEQQSERDQEEIEKLKEQLSLYRDEIERKEKVIIELQKTINSTK